MVGATQEHEKTPLRDRDPNILKKEKATAGITALSFPREQIEERVCDLDVELRFPLGVEALKVRLFVF